MQDTKGENVWNRKCQVPGVGDEMSTTPKGKRMEDGISVASFRGDVAFRSSNVLKRGPGRCAALLKKGVYPGHGRGIPSSSWLKNYYSSWDRDRGGTRGSGVAFSSFIIHATSEHEGGGEDWGSKIEIIPPLLSWNVSLARMHKLERESFYLFIYLIFFFFFSSCEGNLLIGRVKRDAKAVWKSVGWLWSIGKALFEQREE